MYNYNSDKYQEAQGDGTKKEPWHIIHMQQQAVDICWLD